MKIELEVGTEHSYIKYAQEILEQLEILLKNLSFKWYYKIKFKLKLVKKHPIINKN